MCQKDHELAAVRTMGWPELQVWEASSGRDCKAAVSAGTSNRALFA
jgi:hypothetical protein